MSRPLPKRRPPPPPPGGGNGAPETALVLTEVGTILDELTGKLPGKFPPPTPARDYDTITVIFEFAGSATQAYHVQRDGFILGWNASVAVYGISVNLALPGTLPNGANTKIWLGYVAADATSGTNNRPTSLRHPVKTGDIIYVNATVSTVIHVYVGQWK